MRTVTSRSVTVVAHEVRSTGGMERAQREIILGLLARGWRVHLIARWSDLPEQEGLTWTRVRTPRRPFTVAYPLFALVAGAALSRRRSSPITVLGAIVPNRADIVVVQFCHHGFRAYGRDRATRVSWMRRANDRLGSRMALWMERWCYRRDRAAAFVAVSPLVALELEEHFDLAGTVRVVPNGTDPRHFRPDVGRRRKTRADLKLSDGQPVALFVGGDWRRKGLDCAIQAAGAAGWKLLVLGVGDPQMFESTVRTSGADVDFLGTRDDPAAIFSAADAFVLPSSYEGFALVTIEAAASGLPLLVTAATGAGDLARDGAGFELEATPDAFALALRRLVEEPDLKPRMAGAARAAGEALAWPAIVSLYERELDDVMQAR